jgi:hypothetical protein
MDFLAFFCKGAIVINVGLVCFVLPPIRDWDRIYRLTSFLFLEHLFLLMQVMVGLIIPEETEDVKIISDINGDFLSAQRPKEQKKVAQGAQGDTRHIDLSLTDN